MNFQSWILKTRVTIANWLMPPRLESPVGAFKDSTQIGIAMEGLFTPGSFASEGIAVTLTKKGEDDKELRLADNSLLDATIAEYRTEGWVVAKLATVPGKLLPTVSGLTRVYKSFKPTKAILSEMVTATFTGSGLPDLTLREQVTHADDLILIQAFSGADNCFPNAPMEANGVSGSTFSFASLGNDISWPTINSGIDITVGFAIEPSILHRASWWWHPTLPSNYSAVPPGYGLLPSYVHVKARMSLLGPSIR